MESRVWSQPGDVVVLEHWAQNGFANTDLDARLKQHGIQKIVLVGFIANSCVEATGRFGMELGYHVTLIKNATAAFNTEGMTAARVNALLYGHAILTTNELLAALPAPVRKATACEIGEFYIVPAGQGSTPRAHRRSISRTG